MCRRIEMKKKILIFFLMAAVSFSFFACKRKTQAKGISLDVSFSESPLSDNLITEMEYRWKTSSDFVPVRQDYTVFVHFWHKKNMLFQDDHMPEVPTSEWEADKEYTYTRRIHVPPFIDEFDPEFKGEEHLNLSVGLYSPYDRSGRSERMVLERKLKVVPPPLDAPEIFYEEGWYVLEKNPESFLRQWRWTKKEARCIIDNPHSDALLFIKGGINPDALEDQKIIFKINDMILDEFIPEESHFEKSYNIKKEMLGDGEEFYLTIATDKTFIPARDIPNSTDERELGVQISLIYFR
jgi:predicted small secreted protein